MNLKATVKPRQADSKAATEYQKIIDTLTKQVVVHAVQLKQIKDENEQLEKDQTAIQTMFETKVDEDSSIISDLQQTIEQLNNKLDSATTLRIKYDTEDNSVTLNGQTVTMSWEELLSAIQVIGVINPEISILLSTGGEDLEGEAAMERLKSINTGIGNNEGVIDSKIKDEVVTTEVDKEGIVKMKPAELAAAIETAIDSGDWSIIDLNMVPNEIQTPVATLIDDGGFFGNHPDQYDLLKTWAEENNTTIPSLATVKDSLIIKPLNINKVMDSMQLPHQKIIGTPQVVILSKSKLNHDNVNKINDELSLFY